ncbi:tyrosine-type recombinase/integrase [Agrococcus baldri]|uniref:Prophage phiRv2 integrase n=1 Tax=Agrococcus baldri TaxID=153730 RepID=A0AA87RDB0_9MICO|nr:site-specific integrase [Agrococcus baldri]GEK80572.1 putative prophage phiRv2 integrase [Agrococcus baldri]
MAKRKPRESFGRLRKTSAGRWHASYMGPDGARHNAPATFHLVTDARLWLSNQHRDIARGEWTAPGEAKRTTVAARVKLDAYARHWVETRTNRDGEPLRDRTRVEYIRLIDTALAPLGDLALNAITTETVRTWYSALVKSGRKTLAARAYSLLKSIMTTALHDGRIKSNPCIIRGAQNASTGKTVDPPTPADLDKIVKAMPDRLKAAVLLAAWVGARYGELTELRRSDVTTLDDPAGSIMLVSIARAVTHVTGEGYKVGMPKSAAGVRVVPIPPHVAPAVEKHLREHVGPSPDALLFPATGTNSHLPQSSLVKHYYPARKAAGRPDMPWHALRHFGATRAALAGATLKELQARLGHSTVSAAMRYQHTAGRDFDLARRMAKLDT